MSACISYYLRVTSVAECRKSLFSPAKPDGYFRKVIMIFGCGSVPEKTGPYPSVSAELLIALPQIYLESFISLAVGW